MFVHHAGKSGDQRGTSRREDLLDYSIRLAEVGSLEDGGRTYGAGTYVHHGAGSAHRPASAEGCLLFVTLGAPIQEF